jgi:hypothetical protein
MIFIVSSSVLDDQKLPRGSYQIKRKIQKNDGSASRANPRTRSRREALDLPAPAIATTEDRVDLVSLIVGCSCGSVALPLLGIALVAVYRAERARADLALWRVIEPSVSIWSTAGGRDVFSVYLDGDRVRVESSTGSEVCSRQDWIARVERRGLRLRGRWQGGRA